MQANRLIFRESHLCRGRKREAGSREPNGRLRRITAAERKSLLGEKYVVLSQPHRRDGNGGNTSQLCESPIGQFVLRHGLRQELFDAGLEYGALGRFFLAIKARRVDIHEVAAGNGGDVSPQKAKWLASELERLETPLKQFNPETPGKIMKANTMEELNAIGYQWSDSELTGAHNYLVPRLKSILLAERQASNKGGNRLFDLGCGNGAIASVLSELGFDVAGVDPSREGIAQAQSAFPHLKLERGSAYDDLASRFGRFNYVVSLEVVEHVFAPRKYAATLYKLCKDNGIAIVSTPYHGYSKNLALALAGKWDFHLTALWDYGHIKFWSIKTLGILLKEAGFREIVFYRVGRVPPLAKSMIAVARR